MRIDRVTFVPPVTDEVRVLIPAPVDRGGGAVEEILAKHEGPDLLELRGVESAAGGMRHRLGHRGLTDFVIDTVAPHKFEVGRVVAAPRADWWHQDLEFIEGTMKVAPRRCLPR